MSDLPNRFQQNYSYKPLHVGFVFLALKKITPHQKRCARFRLGSVRKRQHKFYVITLNRVTLNRSTKTF
jgi:hypothetical protein